MFSKLNTSAMGNNREIYRQENELISHRISVESLKVLRGSFSRRKQWDACFLFGISGQTSRSKVQG